MKAIVARTFGDLKALDYADWPEPEAVDDRVLIEVAAIGVNFPDALLVQGKYQVKPPLPFVPGMESAGRVLAVGPAVRSVRPGDRVAALTTVGAYAERIAVPEARVSKLDDATSDAFACALLCGYGTAQYALKQRAALTPGETLCVLGASGLTGLAAVQIGKAMGARVIAVASTEEKRALAAASGADAAIGYDGLREALKGLTDGKGVDVAFDPVGGEAFDGLARAMAWQGRLLTIGFASGVIPALPANLALVKGFSLVGVFWGAFIDKEPEVYAANQKELLAWHRSGKVKPVIAGTMPLADAAQALQRIVGRGVSGKLILTP